MADLDGSHQVMEIAKSRPKNGIGHCGTKNYCGLRSTYLAVTMHDEGPLGGRTCPPRHRILT